MKIKFNKYRFRKHDYFTGWRRHMNRDIDRINKETQ